MTLKRKLNLCRDPLSFLVKKYLKNRISLGTLIIVLLINIPIIVAASLNNVWLSTPGRVGLLKDYNWWFLNISSIPATIFFFLWIPQGIKKIIRKLSWNKVLFLRDSDSIKGDRWFSFIEQYNRIYTHWAWQIICLMAVLFFMIKFAVPEHQLFNSWETSGAFIFWYTIFFWGFIFHHGLLMIVRGIIVFIFLNKLFREFRIDVRLLHPDGAGGLSPLSSFSVKIGYLLGVYGLNVVTGAASLSYIKNTRFTGFIFTSDFLIIIGVFIIVAPIAFFAPIGAARSAMKKAKEEFILKISDQYKIDSDHVKEMISSDEEQLKKGLSKLNLLQEMHKNASNFPVWPFNTKNIIRFVSSISVPITLPGLLEVYSRLSSLIMKL